MSVAGRDGCYGPSTRVLKPMAGPASPPSFPACPSLGCGSSAGFSLALSASVGLNLQAAAQSPKSLSSCSDAAPVASQALEPEDGKAGCPTVYSQGACHVGAFQGVAQDGPRLGRSADGGAVQRVQFRKQYSGSMRKVPSLWLSQAPGPSESQSHQEHGSARGYLLLRAAMGAGGLSIPTHLSLARPLSSCWKDKSWSSLQTKMQGSGGRKDLEAIF